MSAIQESGDGPSGKNLSILSSITNILLDTPNGLDLKGDFLFSQGANSGSIATISISNPANITYITKIISSAYGGPNQLAINKNDDNTIYALGFNSDRITSTDITNTSNLVILSNILTDDRDPGGIALKGDYAFVGTQQNGRLECYNISNKNSIAFVSAVLDEVMRVPVWVNIVDNFAFVSDNTRDGFYIIDITDVNNLVIVGGVIKPAAGYGEPYYMDLRDDGILAVPFNDAGAIVLFDVSDPHNVIELGTYLEAGISDDAMGVKIVGKVMFVTCAGLSGGLLSLDISDLNNITFIDKLQDSLITNATQLIIDENVAYVSSPGNNTVASINIT